MGRSWFVPVLLLVGLGLVWSLVGRGPRAHAAAEAQAEARPAVEAPATLTPPPPLVPADPVPAAAPAVGRESLPVAAAAADAVPGSVRLRVLDATTGEPIPDLELALVWGDDDEGEVLTTDAEGRARATAPHAPAPLQVDWHEPGPRDTAYEPEEIEAPAVGAELPLMLSIGPTYRIDLVAPGSLALADLGARLSTRAEERWARNAPATALRAGTASSGGFPWVRFPTERIYGSHARGPWQLQVSSADGLWVGAAEVDRIVGRAPELAAITLRPCARLEGTVADADGHPIETAWMRLTKPVSGPRIQQWFLSEGRFHADGLEPGLWSLAIDSPDHETWTREVELRAGERLEEAVVLTALAPAGSVRGHVTSATGRWHGEAQVALWGHAGSKSNRRVAPTWEETDAGWIGTFAFEDVPEGTYELTWLARDCPFEALPGTTQLVTVPDPGAEIRLLDDVPTAAVVIRVRDALTDTRLGEYDVWWRPEGGWASFRRCVPSDEPLVEAWPVGRPFAWVVRTAEHGLVAGDERDFVREGDSLVAEVALPRGWGVQLFLADPEGNPLEGLRLVCDGAPTAPSGPGGRLPLALARRPEEIRVFDPARRITGGAVDPETFDVDDENWWALPVVIE